MFKILTFLNYYLTKLKYLFYKAQWNFLLGKNYHSVPFVIFIFNYAPRFFTLTLFIGYIPSKIPITYPKTSMVGDK